MSKVLRGYAKDKDGIVRSYRHNPYTPQQGQIRASVPA